MERKRKYDKEYSTQYLKELDYLADKGIKYVFAKTDESGIRFYKYTKTPQLFQALMEFYSKEQN